MVLRKRSEQRKELWHRERLRMQYGLERKSRLHLPLDNSPPRAAAHKYLMIRQCNYFADPLGGPCVVCYDSQTQRSARREATAARHWLKVVEAEE